MIDAKLKQEFFDIEQTRFWKEYVQKLDTWRDNIIRLICTVKIGEPTVRGEVLQEKIKTIDWIMNLPDKMIGTDDNG